MSLYRPKAKANRSVGAVQVGRLSWLQGAMSGE